MDWCRAVAVDHRALATINSGGCSSGLGDIDCVGVAGRDADIALYPC